MKHSFEELLETVYRYYPRGLTTTDPGYRETEEYGRLSNARRQAGVDKDAWNALLKRADARFPGHNILNRSLHLPMGTMDAAYSGCIFLDVTPMPVPTPRPTRWWERPPGPHSVGFLVSFICPYYVVYSSRYVDDIEATEAALRAPRRNTVAIYSGNAMHVVPASVVQPEIRAEAEREDEERRQHLQQHPLQRRVIAFDPLLEEKPIMDHLAHDIEATFGCARMPPEVGNVTVADVATNNRGLGEARLYDCLLSDDW
jgi:hypothetical protein